MKRMLSVVAVVLFAVAGTLSGQKTQTKAECQAAATKTKEACLVSAGKDKTRIASCNTKWNQAMANCSGGGPH